MSIGYMRILLGCFNAFAPIHPDLPLGLSESVTACSDENRKGVSGLEFLTHFYSTA
ncbi:hypothetical protein NC99_05610 [Sunxiuqinia dokdonensis]|uniref:Uncharacterized protein n=1 Tax=Sunxiuqinia dokdonensis TaxID=1409788 RepID=A0A0L8VDP9_9BACT|nr:hypothetical protein NC99_05610 [Sunxiuqinia dokdonensis]